MRSFFSSSKPSFAAALLLTFVVALLPSDWMRWTNGVWNAVDVLVAPFGQAATQLRVWIRGEPTVRVPPGTDVHERLVQLEEEAATALMLHAREKLRVKQLEARLAELEGVRRADPDANTRLIAADITGRSPLLPHGTIDLNVGSRLGVAVGDVAVSAGADLVGRLSEVGRVRSTLLLATNAATGPIEGYVLPRDDLSAPITTRAFIQATPTGTGTWEADVESVIVVSPGDVVRLADRRWSETAQGLIVGEIVSVAPKDQQPLRNRIIIRPRIDARQLAIVTVKVHEQVGDEGGAP